MVKKLTFKYSAFPEKLRQIPDPPKQLYYSANNLKSLIDKPCVAIVGSRKLSPYGRIVTERLAGELANRGIVIVSGLAFGVDTAAHRATLDAGGHTIAVLPSGLDKIYPSSHVNVAKKIVDRGGALISEYPDGTTPFRTNFIARNRIISGLSDALLVTEAASKSGTMHTAGFALEQGREVMAVPGNITSPNSAGTNNLIKSGATPITSVEDILRVLNLDGLEAKQGELFAGSEEELEILEYIGKGVTSADEILAKSQMTPQVFNKSLTMLEISGRVKPLGGNNWTLA